MVETWDDDHNEIGMGSFSLGFIIPNLESGLAWSKFDQVRMSVCACGSHLWFNESLICGLEDSI